MTVGEYIKDNHTCPYCGSSDYYVFDEGVICTIYKCMGCNRKMWETEALFTQEEPITCDNRVIGRMAKKYDDLLEKHLSECRQISKYDIELKKLKNENAKLKQIIDDRNKNTVINEQ